MGVQTRIAEVLADEILALIRSKPACAQDMALTALQYADEQVRAERESAGWPCPPREATPAQELGEDLGGCPDCGRMDLCVNIGRAHFATCTAHKCFWWLGSNLFSGWQSEDEVIWERNRKLLSGYREVEPIYPSITDAMQSADDAKIPW